jgi:NAD(P)-dependent dehydrogenase (short-subunit alcohol dehydrogenase family)
VQDRGWQVSTPSIFVFSQFLTFAGEIGNGRATAILLARQGAKVSLVDFNVEWATETKRMVDDEGGISEVIQADITSEQSCKNAVAKTVELFGTVHILVNIGEWDPFAQVTRLRHTDQRISRCWRCDGGCNEDRYEGLGS